MDRGAGVVKGGTIMEKKGTQVRVSSVTVLSRGLETLLCEGYHVPGRDTLSSCSQKVRKRCGPHRSRLGGS